MENLIINHSKPLYGEVTVSGSKNAVLPILVATVLTSGENIIHDVPELEDVKIMEEILSTVGSKISSDSPNSLKVETTAIKNFEIPYELVTKMRASILLLGPLLARCGKASVSFPGGCAIGSRPIDLHLKGLSAMGADIEQSNGLITASAKKLIGKKIYLDFPSVGATENLIMAAVLAEGETILENAAIEPEIVDLSTYLSSCGAQIQGAGTDTVKITGVPELKGSEHTVISDRIEAGTFMIASAITGGNVLIKNVIPAHLKPITAKLKEANIEVSEELNAIRVKGGNLIKNVDIKTLPYPGFPTDMQAQFATLMTTSAGNSIIVETIFENRFLYVPELIRLGANIKIDGRAAVISGNASLNGAKVKATDLRAGAALILAGLVADGVTTVTDLYHIDRGYEKLDQKLSALGANISRIETE
ncbi:MAG: UDP-N-acetylglucosamine 1-carboxyvinyltransferase [Spirochaetales bacterium]|nr:UDP-N-acetylglucosamine 1-carboxyvinyltransferase [Spirochaetales bacterium]